MNQNVIEEFIAAMSDKEEMPSPGLLRAVLMASFQYAETICDDASRKKSKLFKEFFQEIDGFHYRLNQRWLYPLNLFDAFIVQSLEWGDKRNKEIRENMNSSVHNLADVITRSHAQACQTAWAISALLRKGYASQALVLWRTMHELEITAAFIVMKGNSIAERYMEYQKIEYCKLAGQFRRFHIELGQEPIDEMEWQELEALKKSLKDKYGNDFAEEYGWAAPAFTKTRISFADIEQAVEKSHYRPYYKIASQATHASPMRIYHSVGLLEGAEKVAAAGPSNSGLTLPAHATVISLLHINYLLKDKNIPSLPDFAESGLLQALYFLEKEIGEAFSKVQSEIERDHERFGRKPNTGK